MAERPYRIIYNWDGAPHHYDEHPQSMESFLQKTYAPLAGTQVDALFCAWAPTRRPGCPTTCP